MKRKLKSKCRSKKRIVMAPRDMRGGAGYKELSDALDRELIRCAAAASTDVATSFNFSGSDHRLNAVLCRAARGLCHIDQVVLADEAGVSVETIKRIERAGGNVTASLGGKLVRAFKARGICITDNGVTFRRTVSDGKLEALLAEIGGLIELYGWASQ